MKKALLIFFILSMSVGVFGAVDTLRIKSSISDVTVFFNGAQLSRQFNLKAEKGKHLILLKNLPKEINAQSIQVKSTKNCKILSVKCETEFHDSEKKSAGEKEIESQIEAQNQRAKEIKNSISVYDAEEKLLMDNSLLGKKTTGSDVAALKEAADFYRVRLSEIKQNRLKLTTEFDGIDENIKKLNAQLNEVTINRHKVFSAIAILLECEKDIADLMTVSYCIASAGWEPIYDFRVEDISSPLTIVYNANVFQSSGEDWTNVNLKLSTNNPSLSGSKPVLVDWYIGRRNPYIKDVIQNGIGALKGRVLEPGTGEPVPFANLLVYSGSDLLTNVQTDLDGQFSVKPIAAGVYSIKVSCVGFNPVTISSVVIRSGEPTMHDFTIGKGVSLQEVQISEYSQRSDYLTATSKSNVNSLSGKLSGVNIRGSMGSSDYVEIDGLKVRKIEVSDYISNSLKTTVASMEYEIEIPYTIQSDGEDYLVKIKEASVPVTYLYHIVPKLEADAFLTAEITGWNELNLLSGKAGIYYQGTFIGQSLIDAHQTNDTLSLSLGRDRSIIVSREGNKQVNDKRFAGGNVKETVGWIITARNTKRTNVHLIIEDQYPISELKSIEVELEENSGAKIDTQAGKLEWDIELGSGEKKAISYQYSVKYPKDISLAFE